MIGTIGATPITLQAPRRAGLFGRLAARILAPATRTADGNAISLTASELHGHPADRIAGADGSWSQGRWARLA